jgi:hypothetical protein
MKQVVAGFIHNFENINDKKKIVVKDKLDLSKAKEIKFK